MFNGHMDTSYSGREPWLRGRARASSRRRSSSDGRLYGLGISNMKGALACYVEAVRALQDAGVRLRGDVLIAAVCGEIEKTQYGDAQGAQYRGYAAGSRYLVSHGGVADMCLLGEPTEGKVVLGHFGALWLRIRVARQLHPHRVQRGQARPELDPAHARGDGRGARVDPDLGGRPVERLPRREGDRQRRRHRGRLRLARLAHAAPHRSLPRRPRAADEGDGRRAARGARLRALARASASPTTGSRARSTSRRPGAEIDEGHELVAAIDAAHEEVFGEAPGRDVTRWFSDASALTRYGIPTVNYGTSTGLMDVELGENLEIDGLVKTAETYALVAQRVCAMKLVTYDDGKVGRIDGEEIVRLDVPTMREYFERGGADDTGERTPLADAKLARADRPEEVLPHRRQLPRARGGVEERRLVARRSRRGSTSSRTSTRSSAPTSRSSIRST